jgi:fructose-bisphosphate aldolase class II
LTTPDFVAASPVTSRIPIRGAIATASHCFRHYDGVLKVDGEVGSKKAYDPRSYLALAEQAMAECVKRVTTELRSAGTTRVKA